jgi:hypothetical protein
MTTVNPSICPARMTSTCLSWAYEGIPRVVGDLGRDAKMPRDRTSPPPLWYGVGVVLEERSFFVARP